jgi:hypothetical protein
MSKLYTPVDPRLIILVENKNNPRSSGILLINENVNMPRPVHCKGTTENDHSVNKIIATGGNILS